MKKNFEYKKVSTIISAIFIAVLMAVVFNFTLIGSKGAEEKVEQYVINAVEDFVLKTYEEINDMTLMAVPISGLIGELNDDDSKVVIMSLVELVENSKAYMSLASNNEGRAITHTGRLVDVSNETYYEEIVSDKQNYYYVEHEGVTGKEAIVSTVPIKIDDQVTGTLFTYYCLDIIREKQTTEGIYASTFMLFSLNNGEIVLNEGENVFVQEHNIFDEVKKLDKSEAKIIQQTMNKVESGSSKITKGEQSTYLVYAPLNINKWYFTIGIKEDYIGFRVADEWKDIRIMLIILVALIVLSIVSFVFFSIMSQMKNVRNHVMLEEKADRDLLTGIYNKIATEKKIKEYITRNPKSKGILFLIDIDNFKNINDTKGHVFGDEVLKNIGFRMCSELRAGDIVGRVGGDEFMIFLKNVNGLEEQDKAKEIARVAQLFANFKVGEFSKYTVTASIGGAIYGEDAMNFEALYKNADKAVYRAKKQGKNCLVMYKKDV